MCAPWSPGVNHGSFHRIHVAHSDTAAAQARAQDMLRAVRLGVSVHERHTHAEEKLYLPPCGDVTCFRAACCSLRWLRGCMERGKGRELRLEKATVLAYGMHEHELKQCDHLLKQDVDKRPVTGRRPSLNTVRIAAQSQESEEEIPSHFRCGWGADGVHVGQVLPEISPLEGRKRSGG